MSVLSDASIRDMLGTGEHVGPAEEWRDIPGYEGRYQVSSLGNARGIGIGGSGKQGKPLKSMASTRNGQTYLQVALYRNGRRHYFKLHHLVLLAFEGPRPDGYEVNHIDGSGVNNRLANLEYVTRSDNLKHAYRIGLRTNRGEKNPAALLSSEQARVIYRRFHDGGETGAALAREFGVSRSAVSNITVGKTWGSVCQS